MTLSKSEVSEYKSKILELLVKDKVGEIDNVTSKLDWYDFIKVLKSGVYIDVKKRLESSNNKLKKLIEKWDNLLRIHSFVKTIKKLLKEDKIGEIDKITSVLKWYDFVKLLKSGVYDIIQKSLDKEPNTSLNRLFQKWNSLLKEHNKKKQSKLVVTPSPLPTTPPYSVPKPPENKLDKTETYDKDSGSFSNSDSESTSSSESDSESETIFPIYWNLRDNFTRNVYPHNNLCRILSEKKLKLEDIEKRRGYIYTNIKKYLGLKDIDLKQPEKLIIFFNKIDRVGVSNFFQKLLDLYDEVFFENTIKDYFCAGRCDLHFCWNNRCTSVAGRCSLTYGEYSPRGTIKRKKIKLEMSSKVFYNSFDKIKSDYKVANGLKCHNVLFCLMLIFEHEFVHAIMQCTCFIDITKNSSWGQWTGVTKPSNGHSKTFMSITNDLFGHTEYVHDLLSILPTTLKPVNPDWNPYKNLKKGDLIKYNFSERRGNVKITDAIVIDTGGRRTKRLLVKNLEVPQRWNISYQTIISYRDSSGKVHDKYI